MWYKVLPVSVLLQTEFTSWVPNILGARIFYPICHFSLSKGAEEAAFNLSAVFITLSFDLCESSPPPWLRMPNKWQVCHLKNVEFRLISIATGSVQSKAQKPRQENIFECDTGDADRCIVTPVSPLVLIQPSQYLPSVMDLKPLFPKIARGLWTTSMLLCGMRTFCSQGRIGAWEGMAFRYEAVLTHGHLFQTIQSCSAQQRYALLRSALAEYWEIMPHDEHNKELDLKNRFCQCVYLLQKRNSIKLQCVVCSGGEKKKAYSQCYAALKMVMGKIKCNKVELAANFVIFFSWPGWAEQIFSMTQPENSPLATPRGAYDKITTAGQCIFTVSSSLTLRQFDVWRHIHWCRCGQGAGAVCLSTIRGMSNISCPRATYKRLKTCLSRVASTTHLSLLICGADAAQHARVCENMAKGRVHKCMWARLPRVATLVMLPSFDVECFHHSHALACTMGHVDR